MEESKKRLPKRVEEFAPLFSDDDGASDLSPLRENLDHAINLRQEDGKTLTPPWGPRVYNMSREELPML